MTQRLDFVLRPVSRSHLAGVALLAALSLAAGCDPEPAGDADTDIDADDDGETALELRSAAATSPSYDLDSDPSSGRRLNTNALGAVEFSNLDFAPGATRSQSLKLLAIETGAFFPHRPWEQDDIWPGVPVDLATLSLDGHLLRADNMAGQVMRHSDFHGSRWTVRVEEDTIDAWVQAGEGVAYTPVAGESYGLVELLLTVGWSTLPAGAVEPDLGDEDSQELAYAAAGAVPLYTFWYEKDGRNGDDEIGMFESCQVPEGGYHTTTAVLYEDLFVDERDGVVKQTSDSLYVGCVAGAVGKAATWGYWPDEVPALSQFESVLRMIRADYCGDGWSYTREGTPLGEVDRWGVIDPSPELSTLESDFFEAVWRGEGAACVNHIRDESWGSLHCSRPSCDQLDPGGSFDVFDANVDSLLSWF